MEMIDQFDALAWLRRMSREKIENAEQARLRWHVANARRLESLATNLKLAADELEFARERSEALLSAISAAKSWGLQATAAMDPSDPLAKDVIDQYGVLVAAMKAIENSQPLSSAKSTSDGRVGGCDGKA